MKVLQICHKPPKPELDGGAIAINQISEGLLNAGIDLEILMVETQKHPFQAKLFDDPRLTDKLHAVFIDTSVSIVKAVKAFIQHKNFNLSRFKSDLFRSKLTTLLQQNSYDVIHVESLYVAVYIDTIKACAPNSKIVYRSHNLEHLIWERLSKQASGIKKWYLKHLAKTLKIEEITILKQFDAIASISQREIPFFNKLGIKKVINLPFGVDVSNVPVYQKQDKIRFFHLASMDWQPNMEAVRELLFNVWPEFMENTAVELHVAGRYMPDEFLAFNGKGNIIVNSEIKSAEQFILENDVLLLPLQSGGGIRIKVLEAMKYGKCILSTAVGVEGIDLIDKQEAFIVDEVSSLSKVIHQLINSPDLIEKCGTNAFNKAKSTYDKNRLIEQLLKLYHEC